MAIELDSISAMINLGSMSIKDGKLDLAEKYFLMCVEKAFGENIPVNINVALNCLGCIYFKQKKYRDAEKYFLIAIENKNALSMVYLAMMYEAEYLILLPDSEKDTRVNRLKYFEKIGKLEIIEKYYMMAINANSFLGLKKLEGLYDFNKYKLATKLSMLTPSSHIGKSRLAELMNDKSIRIFTNKYNLLSKKESCPICYEENTTLIPMECVHYYCSDCYLILNKCAMCEN